MRGQAYRRVQKVQDTRSKNRRRVRTSSLGPEPEAVDFHYLLSEGKETLRIRRWTDTGSDSSVEMQWFMLMTMRYLCFRPCLLRTFQAFGVLDYCTWPQRPAGKEKQPTVRARSKKGHCVFITEFVTCDEELKGNECQVPSDSSGWTEGFWGETGPVCWKRRGCRPETPRRTSSWCRSPWRSLVRCSAASLWLMPRCRHLCCSPPGPRSPPGLSILLREWKEALLYKCHQRKTCSADQTQVKPVQIYGSGSP